ncbi:MAG: hypothetical protein AB7U43_05260, partial [Desulfobacter sp.]
FNFNRFFFAHAAASSFFNKFDNVQQYLHSACFASFIDNHPYSAHKIYYVKLTTCGGIGVEKALRPCGRGPFCAARQGGGLYGFITCSKSLTNQNRAF